MMAMPNPDTMAAAYSVQTSTAAARPAPPSAAIVIPSVIARVAPPRAIKASREYLEQLGKNATSGLQLVLQPRAAHENNS